MPKVHEAKLQLIHDWRPLGLAARTGRLRKRLTQGRRFNLPPTAAPRHDGAIALNPFAELAGP
jgi:hypothetical protein